MNLKEESIFKMDQSLPLFKIVKTINNSVILEFNNKAAMFCEFNLIGDRIGIKDDKIYITDDTSLLIDGIKIKTCLLTSNNRIQSKPFYKNIINYFQIKENEELYFYISKKEKDYFSFEKFELPNTSEVETKIEHKQ